MFKKIAKISLYSFLWLAGLSTALAQGRPPIVPVDPEGKIDELVIPHAPAGASNEQYFGGIFIPAFTKVVIGAAGATAVLFIIIGGVEFLTAYGNEEKITKGKKTITYAIIGLLIAILSYAIVTIISSINLGTP